MQYNLWRFLLRKGSQIPTISTNVVKTPSFLGRRNFSSSLFRKSIPGMIAKPDLEFPPLPIIQSESIRKGIFTHRSLHGRPTNVFEDPALDPSPDYERFEFLGDSILYLVVTDLMLDAYPHLRVGPSTKIRALVVMNTNLAAISMKYKLPEQLHCHPAQAVTLRNSTNIQADVFEAYVGGLFIDQNMDVVKAWLKPLLFPYIEDSYQLIRDEYGSLKTLEPGKQAGLSRDNMVPRAPQDTGAYSTEGHLALFNQHLRQEQKQVEWSYIDIDDDAEADIPSFGESDISLSGTELVHQKQINKMTTPTWHVKVTVDDKVIGIGKGYTKRAARDEAAKQGLLTLGLQI